MRSYSREELSRCYKEMFEPTFPVDERPPVEDFCDYFLTDKYKDRHHIEIDDEHCLMYCDLDDGVKVVEFFVIRKECRGNGLGTKIFSEWLERNGHPRLMMEIDSENALRFWRKFGVRKISGYEYIQPPLNEGQNRVDWMFLSANFDPTAEETTKMVRSWFKYGFGIEGLTIQEAYKKYIEPEFIPDERYPIKEFCEYFDKPGHHIEFDERSCIAWCDLSDGIKWIIFFVVDKDHRNSGEGTKIFQDWNERNDKPKLVIDAASDDAFRFWKRLGFNRVENYEYVQPALFPGMNPVSSLIFAANFDAYPEKIDSMMKEYFAKELHIL